MAESYSFSKEQRLGIYEIIESIYKSHERRLRNLEQMVDLLRQGMDKIQREQYVSPVSRNEFRLSDWVRDYYLPHTLHPQSSQKEKMIVKQKGLGKVAEQISQFIQENPRVTTSEIISKLGLDSDIVNSVLVKLEKEGKIRGQSI